MIWVERGDVKHKILPSSHLPLRILRILLYFHMSVGLTQVRLPICQKQVRRGIWLVWHRQDIPPFPLCTFQFTLWIAQEWKTSLAEQILGVWLPRSYSIEQLSVIANLSRPRCLLKPFLKSCRERSWIIYHFTKCFTIMKILVQKMTTMITAPYWKTNI